MLKAYICGGSSLIEVDPREAQGEVIWYDMLNPDTAEYSFVAAASALKLPAKDRIVEIENSSRLASEGSVLTLSMPLATRSPEGLQSSACGFVLAPTRLITIRFAESLVFNGFPAQPHETGQADSAQSAFVFAGLLEAIVDRQADALEKLRSELDELSHQVFHHRFDRKPDKSERRGNPEAELQAMLVTLGKTHEAISFLRDSQLGIHRIAPYVEGTADWLPKPVRTRLKSLHKDISSLNEFSTHLSDKVQFLLDATLGLINIAQNGLIKVLTIVSIVGIPPTLIAGIYGMNFHIIPELSWDYGYLYAWVIMILSAVLPLAWFRKKGWV